MIKPAKPTPEIALEPYQHLTAIEPNVLPFLAIPVVSTHRTHVANGLRAAGIQGKADKPLHTQTLTPILPRLDDLGLVITG